MIDIIGQLGAFDAVILGFSAIVAFMGAFCSYRHISGVLFSITCIVIGVQTIMTSPIVLYINTESTAYMYFILLSVYGMASVIYAVMGSKYLLTTSLIICAFLGYVMVNALYAVEIAHYVKIINFLWLTQIMGGLSGVLDRYGLLNGVRGVLSNLRSHITNHHHKGI